MAKLRYPTGVRPLLVAETARRRRTESRIVSILERAGFAEIILPIIDYAEPYAPAGSIASRETYRFVDRDGDLVSVRSDFTPLAARALAPTIVADALPLRIFYRGDVIRFEPTRLGANREMFQIGAEIIGDPSPAADVETLSLILSILREFGTEPRVVFTDATIPERLAGDDAPEEVRDGIREALAAKRASEIRHLRKLLPRRAGELVATLADGTATLDDLRAYPPTQPVAERLQSIAASAGSDCIVHLDDVDRARGYYTGLRFRAYDASSRATIAQGGRYDSLYGLFGTPAAAVGFTITIDDLD